MEKSERNKSRPAVKTSNHTNRKMDFLSEVTERSLYGTTFSNVYAGNDRVNMDRVALTRDRSYLKVPLDQKNCDQHQSKLTIQAVMGAISDNLEEQRVGFQCMKTWRAL